MTEKTFDVILHRVVEVRVRMTGPSAAAIRALVAHSVDTGDSMITDMMDGAIEKGGLNYDAIVLKSVKKAQPVS